MKMKRRADLRILAPQDEIFDLSSGPDWFLAPALPRTFGKHESYRWAEDAQGYPRQSIPMPKRPSILEQWISAHAAKPQRIIRAIPVEGSVEDPGPSWKNSPQVLAQFGITDMKKQNKFVVWLKKGGNIHG